MSINYEHIPEHDPRINLETLDIFSPSDRWRSITLIPRSTQQPQQSSNPKPVATTAANKNNEPNNLYCTACKKKFSNEATFQGHVKSAKHIANEKKNKANKKAGNNNNAASGRQQQQPQDPAVKDALNKLKQALTVAKSSNPVPAIGVLWSLSKSFYTLKRPQNTIQALDQLVQTLETLQSSSDKTTGLTPSQIASTLYASRLALARLLCLYKTCISYARTLSLNALQGKWKIDREQLVTLAEQCGEIPLDRVMVQCRNLGIRYIEREEKREGGLAAPKSDKNQSFVAILTEAAAMFQNDTEFENNDDDDRQGRSNSIATDDMVTLDGQFKAPSNNVAIVLLCLTAIISKYETGFQPYYYMEKVSEVYEKCAKLHQASQARVISHGMSADNKSVASWNLFMALLLALEIGDFVRVDNTIRIIENEGLNRSYMDMQVLVSLSKACKECDYTTLKHTIPHQLEHLELLLQETTDTDMVLRHLTDPMKQSDTIVRLQMVAALVPN